MLVKGRLLSTYSVDEDGHDFLLRVRLIKEHSIATMLGSS